MNTRYRVGKFTVHTGARQQNQEFRTGCSVPNSGIYRVLHTQHRLPQEVTLVQNQSFPRCSKCNDLVYFELVHSTPSAGGPSGFTVTLYELPAEDESLTG